jgi:hypothetical protein
VARGSRSESRSASGPRGSQRSMAAVRPRCGDDSPAEANAASVAQTSSAPKGAPESKRSPGRSATSRASSPSQDHRSARYGRGSSESSSRRTSPAWTSRLMRMPMASVVKRGSSVAGAADTSTSMASPDDDSGEQPASASIAKNPARGDPMGRP